MAKSSKIDINVNCPTCKSMTGAKCRTKTGAELNRVHTTRTELRKALVRLNQSKYRGELPGHYQCKQLLVVERSQLDPGVSEEQLAQARMTNRNITENAVIETYLDASGNVEHVIETGGNRFFVRPELATEMHRQRYLLLEQKAADSRAQAIVDRLAYGNVRR